MTIVALKKQTGFNQDFEFRCFGGKYQVLFFNQVSNRTNSKQEKIRIPCLPICLQRFVLSCRPRRHHAVSRRAKPRQTKPTGTKEETVSIAILPAAAIASQ